MENPKKPIIVQKYGGSSLATPQHIKNIARHIVDRKNTGIDLVIVVSAMGKTTDQYVKLAHELNPNPDRREMDMLLSVGERISIAALALAINATGEQKAISFTGSQIGIITDNNHTQARILEIKGHRLLQALDEDKIVIVAGFQGVSLNKEITTLGRGGSDTTAVALAAALKADYCEIMSDIDGIYSADPKLIKTAKRIDYIHYDQALEMASAGAKMLQQTSVEFAKRHQVKLSLGSSTTGEIGTIVTNESLNKNCVSGITIDKNLSIIRFSTNQNNTLLLPYLFSKEKIMVKIWQLVQGLGIMGVSQSDSGFVKRLVEPHINSIHIEDKWAALTVVGAGVGIGSKTCQLFLETLEKLLIQPELLRSDELYLKIIIEESKADNLLEELHKVFFND